MIDARAMSRAVEILDSSAEIVFACHVGPDGDALGSMLGLAAAARNASRKVYASFGEPFVVGSTFRFLPVELLVPPSAVPPGPETMVSLDAGSLDRLGDLETVAVEAGELIVIDHHRSNKGFGTVDLIDPDAAATAEIVLGLIDSLGWELTPEIATCLHTGIVTDTGRFQYSNTSPATLNTAARLIEAGARPEVIGQHCYEESPFGFLKLAGVVLERAELDPTRRVVWSVMTKSDLDEAGVSLDDTDPLIDLLRVAEESDVAVLAKALEPERTKVSLRSRGRVDVGTIASALGGGGHHNAAGVTLGVSAREAVDSVLELLPAVDD